MLIIFDLDDTLIDTSVSVVPYQFRKSLQFAKDRGLVFDEAKFEKLLCSHAQAPSSEVALEQFLEEQGAESFLVFKTLEEYRTLPDPSLEIAAVPYAIDVLKALASHCLSIVTRGKKELQHYKLKKAGVFPHFFSKIVATEGKDKKESYRLLLEEYPYLPIETIVVGDRVEFDLGPAKELGCRTIRFMRGRGIYGEQKDKIVDFVIHDLRELPEVIKPLS